MKKYPEKWHTLCGGQNGRPWMALAEDGTLWTHPYLSGPADGVVLSDMEGWQPVNFNENYAGYYEACDFTALACTTKDFVVAGLGKDGLPYVYRSLLGGVWDQISLTGGNPVSGWIRADGRINGILYQELTNQIFLYCDNGQLVTLPDCPKCVRIRQVSDQAVVSGKICGEHLELELADHTVLRVGMSDVMQLRVSYSYAKKCLKDGGSVVWLGRDLPDFERLTEACLEAKCEVLNIDKLREWLEVQQKDMFMAFWCDFGTQADEAAACARRMGFDKAYSLGGARQALHVE